METIYGYSGEAIGFIQRDGDSANAYDGRGDFLGWTDGQNVYARDGSLVAKGENVLGILFRTGNE